MLDVLFAKHKINCLVAMQPSLLINFAAACARDLFLKIYILLGQQSLDGRFSTSRKTLEFPINEDASIRVNKFIQAFFNAFNDTECKDEQYDEGNLDKTVGKNKELSKETPLVAGTQEEPRKSNEKRLKAYDEEETPTPIDDLDIEEIQLTLDEGNAMINGDFVPELEMNQPAEQIPVSDFRGKDKQIDAHLNTDTKTTLAALVLNSMTCRSVFTMLTCTF